jgi:hypothetical protein
VEANKDKIFRRCKGYLADLGPKVRSVQLVGPWTLLFALSVICYLLVDSLRPHYTGMRNVNRANAETRTGRSDISKGTRIKELERHSLQTCPWT